MNRAGRALAALVLVLLWSAGARADPSALWRIVHDRCVPNQMRHDDPTPCALVDLSRGVARGYVVLKDRRDATQCLVLPTARLTGIESPALPAPNAPDYMQDAWTARRFVRARAPATLARDDLSLAVNSVYGRTQNQLHIHVDCLRRDVRDALARQRDDIGDEWRRFPEPLVGHTYIARRLIAADLAGVNPFRMLADSGPDERAHMGDYTLVIAGVAFGGRLGFILLADRADLPNGDFGSGEELQDHDCAVAH
ncbi:MAG: CDP-diacylglycerol diphosphatase [Alphaproteobacteria bacterium]|nr:CDP-diacylglycerol diphosphatase [Alphaproteobacteria bacterium]